VQHSPRVASSKEVPRNVATRYGSPQGEASPLVAGFAVTVSAEASRLRTTSRSAKPAASADEEYSCTSSMVLHMCPVRTHRQPPKYTAPAPKIFPEMPSLASERTNRIVPLVLAHPTLQGLHKARALGVTSHLWRVIPNGDTKRGRRSIFSCKPYWTGPLMGTKTNDAKRP